MGESRTELLAWVNDLLELNYTKIEQAGTGAAYCQIMDSVFNDVNMSKVKFDTKHEYEYVGNFKVLQHTFDKHKIDKIIPVDKLMKCKFQDNLEFVQWIKRYWEQNYQGGEYSAAQRRKGGGRSTAGAGAAAVGSTARKAISNNSPAARTPTNRAPAGRQPIAKAGGGSGDASKIGDLKAQVNELKVTVDGLEKERDFYFGKLREIEILVQEQLESSHGEETADGDCIKEIQAILYRTEEGFEVPPEGEEDEQYDDETF
ncbi:hypothetical protein [Parasitella parasitica]|uniref:EB1 C-terminal domain-containing protein n=1 Tax=Parasitella parasitica TaxID=35722 RepID=A0A0B7MX34_9FUNG|nr:hypothetical protein [Parasitella parasitica]